MKTVLLALLALIGSVVITVVVTGALAIGAVALQRHDCQKKAAKSAAMDRAAQLCASELVGCAVSFEQAVAVLEAKQKVLACRG